MRKTVDMICTEKRKFMEFVYVFQTMPLVRRPARTSLLYLYCLPQHCLRDVSKSSEKHKWTIVVSRPLIQLEIIESFKFTSLTVTHKRIIIPVERIIQFEIKNSSLPTFSVELTPVKAVWHTWKYQSFGYLRLNNSTYTQKRTKIS